LSICVGESPAPEFKALVLIFTKEQYSGFRLGRPLDKSLPEENSVLGTEPGTPGLDWVGLWIRAFQKKTVCWGQNFWQAQDRDSISAGPSVKATQLGP
jgi:hypothetical protein